MSAFKNLTGMHFGRLTVSDQWKSTKRPSHGTIIYWLCKCDCGTEIWVRANSLTTNNSQSCGCLYKETRGKAVTTHGRTGTPEYQSWGAMKERCYNKNAIGYDNYGGRGITVCDRWRDSFENFFADMGPKSSPGLSIDRLNNNEGYSPDNCQWQTRTKQNRNTRANIKVDYQGKTVCLSEACELANVNYRKIQARMFQYWHCSFEEALAGGRN